MKENLLGIICSKDLSKAYCVENSEYHKKKILGNGLENEIAIVYIPCTYLNNLIHESFDGNKFKWNIKKILENRKEA